MTRSLPPYPTGDWKSWATQLVDYLLSRERVESESLPAPVLLARKDERSKATTDGIMMYDPVNKQPVYSKNNAWVPVDAGGGGGGSSAVATVGDTFPATPEDGALHYLTTNPIGLYVYYEDVDSAQWVQTNGGTGGDYIPSTGGDLTPTGEGDWSLTYDNVGGIGFNNGDIDPNEKGELLIYPRLDNLYSIVRFVDEVGYNFAGGLYRSHANNMMVLETRTDEGVGRYWNFKENGELATSGPITAVDNLSMRTAGNGNSHVYWRDTSDRARLVMYYDTANDQGVIQRRNAANSTTQQILLKPSETVINKQVQLSEPASQGAPGILFTNNWANNNCVIYGYHSPGQFAGIDMRVGSTSPVYFSMRNNGVGYSNGGWQQFSTREVKRDLTRVAAPLDIIGALTGYRYFRTDITDINGAPIEQVGLVAEEVKAVLPMATTTDGPTTRDGKEVSGGTYYDPSQIVAVLVEAVKELRAEVEALKNGG